MADRLRRAAALRDVICDAMTRAGDLVRDKAIQTESIPVNLHGQVLRNVISLWFRGQGAEPKPDCLITFAAHYTGIQLDKLDVLWFVGSRRVGPSERRIDKVSSYFYCDTLSVYAVPLQAEEALEKALNGARNAERFFRP